MFLASIKMLKLWGGGGTSSEYIPCRINLIRFHAGVDQSFPNSNEKQMEWMRDYLTTKGITTTIRRSRGEDILAACGMLVNALKS